jgi:peptidoglycan/xylan/chitin deacetylase (PgdA/CDA1 family)
VVLTFDGGSEANASQEILDILKVKGVRTTVFLTGEFMQKYPDLVRRMVQEGHEVGNHTMNHPHLTTYPQNRRQEARGGVNRQFVHRELLQAAALFQEVTGRHMAPYWRAPYGEHNVEIRRWAAELGYLHIGWTRDPAAGEDLDSRDWVADPESRIYASAREIRERILGFGKGRGHGASGGIILLHLGTQRRQDQVHRELPEIIDRFLAQGYQLVTISELLEPLKAASAPPTQSSSSPQASARGTEGL